MPRHFVAVEFADTVTLKLERAAADGKLQRHEAARFSAHG
jgi:hypothetical protein